MTLHLWLTNLVNYSAQIAAVIAVGSLAPFLFRVRRPDLLLVYRQLLLAACLLLPLLQPWKRPAAALPSDDISITGATFTTTAAVHARPGPTIEQSAMFVLCAGALVRFCWLALGLIRLRRHSVRAERAIRLPDVFEDLQWRLGVRPSVGFCSEIAGPVTFGIRNPVILLPSRFLEMPAGAQEAIVCHEMAHIRRGDWAFTVGEEAIRAVLWFHPGIWWLLGQIQLTREQAVDREVVNITASREQYIDALLAVAGGRPQLDLAPASSFLQKSHLSQRVALLLKGASMSKQRLLSSFAAIGGVLAVTARLAVFYFPIGAPAQEVVRGESHLLHRGRVEYPADAIAKGIQGTVVVAATLNERGTVADARAVSGPEPLRKAALKSVLDWHYSGQAQSPVEVAIDFKLPAKTPAASTDVKRAVVGGVSGGVRGASPTAAPAFESGMLHWIQLIGVSSQLREALEGRIPVRVGDEIQADTLTRVNQAIREIDEHLDARISQLVTPQGNREYSLHIISSLPMVTPVPSESGRRIRVGGNVQSSQLISGPKPTYPPAAKLDRIQGVARLNVIIGKDGTVQNIQPASGDPVLVEAAVDAVRQWIYKPTLLSGEPVEVITVVDVNFTLKQ